MNYYERYCGDYGRDTAHLALVEHGVYTLLLDTYYSTERPLPEPYDRLYRICSAVGKTEQAAVRSVADEFFPVGPDYLRHNSRADREIAKAAPKIAAARLNGKHGGRPRKNPVGYENETQQEPSGLPENNPSATHPGEAFSPSTTPHSLNSTTSSGSTSTTASRNAVFRQQAKDALERLNRLTGHHYESVPANIDLIIARLKEGYTERDLRVVVANKVNEWKTDEKMAKHLTPKTLFNRTNFATYAGQIPQLQDDEK